MSSPTDPSQANSEDAGKTGIFGGGWRSENEDPAAEYLRKSSEPPTAPYQVASPPAAPPSPTWQSSSNTPAVPPPYQPPANTPAVPPPYQPSANTPAVPPPYQPGVNAPSQQWGTPQYGNHPGFAPAPPAEGLAVGSMIVGIISLALGCAYGIGLLGGPIAIVMGIVAKRRIRASNGQLGGGGQATAGIVLGVLATVLLVAGIAFFIFVGLAVLNSPTSAAP